MIPEATVPEGEHVTDERVEQLFNLADEIIKAPSRFTKDFVVLELGQAVAELAGAVERARAGLAEMREKLRSEWGVRVDGDTDASTADDEAEARWRASYANSAFSTITPHRVVRRLVGEWRDVDQEGDET